MVTTLYKSNNNTFTRSKAECVVVLFLIVQIMYIIVNKVTIHRYPNIRICVCGEDEFLGEFKIVEEM